MSAAFDTVDHGILLNRLEKSFGVRQATLGWVRSYLIGRKQKILSTGGHDTVIEGISTGVPQGSVLGPILFSLYVADIEQLVKQHGLSSHQYADDIQIYGYSKPEEIITLVQQTVECFCAIAAWASSNRLHLNSSKQRQYGSVLTPSDTLSPQYHCILTELMLFHRGQFGILGPIWTRAWQWMSIQKGCLRAAMQHFVFSEKQSHSSRTTPSLPW